MSAITQYSLRRQYKMAKDEIRFVESLPKLNGEESISYTRAQKAKLDAICSRLGDMNGHTEWHWMLRGANTADFKTTRANAQHIYLLGLSKLKWELSFQDAAIEFLYALNSSHIWYRKLLANAYELAAK